MSFFIFRELIDGNLESVNVRLCLRFVHLGLRSILIRMWESQNGRRCGADELLHFNN